VTHAIWAVRTVAAAEADLEDIGRWTEDQFGAAQADIYAQILADALAALSAGPAAVGVRPRPEIGVRLYSLHAGRHFVAQILADALAALSAGPAAVGVRPRPEIGVRLYSLHAGRHFVVFRASREKDRSIVVLRVLHDTMDLARHVPEAK